MAGTSPPLALASSAGRVDLRGGVEQAEELRRRVAGNGVVQGLGRLGGEEQAEAVLARLRGQPPGRLAARGRARRRHQVLRLVHDQQRQRAGSSCAGLRLTQENRAIWSWLTKPCHCSRLGHADPADHADAGALAWRRREQQARVGGLACPAEQRVGGAHGPQPVGELGGDLRRPGLLGHVLGKVGEEVDERAEIAAGAAGEVAHRLGQHRLLLRVPARSAAATPTRGASASTAASTAALNSSTSSRTAPKSGSGWKVSGAAARAARGPDDDVGVVQVAARAFGVPGKPGGRGGRPGVAEPRQVVVGVKDDRRDTVQRALLDHPAQQDGLAGAGPGEDRQVPAQGRERRGSRPGRPATGSPTRSTAARPGRPRPARRPPPGGRPPRGARLPRGARSRSGHLRSGQPPGGRRPWFGRAEARTASAASAQGGGQQFRGVRGHAVGEPGVQRRVVPGHELGERSERHQVTGGGGKHHAALRGEVRGLLTRHLPRWPRRRCAARTGAGRGGPRRGRTPPPPSAGGSAPRSGGRPRSRGTPSGGAARSSGRAPGAARRAASGSCPAAGPGRTGGPRRPPSSLTQASNPASSSAGMTVSSVSGSSAAAAACGHRALGAQRGEPGVQVGELVRAGGARPAAAAPVAGVKPAGVQRGRARPVVAARRPASGAAR